MTTTPTNGAKKRHPLLAQLAAARAGQRTRGHVDVLGTRYEFELLGPEADEWVVAHTPAQSLVSFAVGRRRFRFAAALRGIQLPGEPRAVTTEELWALPEDEEERKRIPTDDPASVRYWRRAQILAFIAEEGIETADLRAFDEEYDRLDALRFKAFQGVDPKSFSKGTTSQDSEVTSSSAKES